MKISTVSSIKDNFVVFSSNKDNHPYKCKTYGTKYPGRIKFIHYMLYATLRGKSPEKCSHNPRSERYQENLDILVKLRDWLNGGGTDNHFNWLLAPFLGGDVDVKTIKDILC